MENRTSHTLLQPDVLSDWCGAVLLRDTHTRRLVLGEHAPGVKVEVVSVGGMLRFSEAVDVLGCQSSRHLDEHV